MKGQKLFVRIATPADSVELDEFYSNEQASRPLDDQMSLIGKVVGTIVAHLSYRRSGGAVRIESVYVARLLRRKRVGRFMVSELARIGTDERIDRIEVDSACEAASFFQAIGFRETPEGGTLVQSFND